MAFGAESACNENKELCVAGNPGRLTEDANNGLLQYICVAGYPGR